MTTRHKLSRYTILILLALACPAGAAFAQTSSPPKNPHNPPLFERFAAPPSGLLRLLLSDRGRGALMRLRPAAAAPFFKALGVKPGTQLTPEQTPDYAPPSGIPAPSRPGDVVSQSPAVLIKQSPQAVTVAGCGSNGTVFNLEPAANAAPQFAETVDFFYNGLGTGLDLVMEGADDFNLGGAAYYVHTSTTGCSPAFEGVLPDLTGLSAETDSSVGAPVVAADPPRGVFYMADMHSGSSNTGGTTAIGLFITSRPNLLNPAVCPPGIQTKAQAKTCWLSGALVNPLPNPMNNYQQDSPSLAVDTRVSGVGVIGPGTIYVTGTEFNFTADTSRIWLVACTEALKCSIPIYVSANDTSAQFSQVAVRADGGITVTYLQSTGTGAVDIKYVACRPQNPKLNPSCAPPVLVNHETQPIPNSLIAETFPVYTTATHTSRTSGGVTQTFVTWNRCKVAPALNFCPDSDVVMKFSTNNGANWSGVVNVNVNSGDQYLPAISTDTSRATVNLAYYDNHVDTQFHHRLLVDLNQILPGATTPTATQAITSTPNDPSGFFLVLGLFDGDHLGLASHGNGVANASRIFTGFSYNLRQGTYSGIPAPQEDNYLQRLFY